MGFPREQRPFKPHLTLGRVKDHRGMDAFMKEFVKTPFPEIQFSVQEVLVMKSELSREGAKYSVQKAVSLQNT
ncbi:MAG: hypothetical protein D6732_29720 [Methanobacteriota archaeon]|nr:MAG: hypothetical protein D6732_29720 [Euryarchaeota archaeon]